MANPLASLGGLLLRCAEERDEATGGYPANEADGREGTPPDLRSGETTETLERTRKTPTGSEGLPPT